MNDPLTQTQLKALNFIRSNIAKSGVPPTLRELCEYMGYSAVGSAQDLVSALRRKGFLETPDRQAARNLLLTSKARQRDERTRRGSFVPIIGSDSIMVPCLGKVPAGHPLEAIEDADQFLSVTPQLFGRAKPKVDALFALRATGLSMIEAGILDGDWLVVESVEEADVGAIVVARLESDATVKRFMRDRTRGYYLKPENPAFEPIFAEDHPFQVIGRVVALQRTL